MDILPQLPLMRDVNCPRCGMFVRSEFASTRPLLPYFNMCPECQLSHSRAVTVPRGKPMRHAVMEEAYERTHALIQCPGCGCEVRVRYVADRPHGSYYNLCDSCRKRPIPDVWNVRTDRLPVLSVERQSNLALLGWIHQWITHQLSPSTRLSRTGVSFDAESVTDEYLLDMWNLQGGRCALSGREMIIPNWRTVGNSSRGRIGRHPTGASIDRIDSAIGYQSGNIQIVCYAVNVMKSSKSDSELLAWCADIIKTRG